MDRWIRDGRNRARRALARIPTTDPELVRPARLVLRLEGRAQIESTVDWDEVVSSAVAWLGPLPVGVICGDADPMTALSALRTAFRLGCRTSLEVGAQAVDDASTLVRTGLESVRIVVDAPAPSLASFVLARGASLDIEVAVSWGASTDSLAILRWARHERADGFRVMAPYRASQVPDPSLLIALDAERPFYRSAPVVLDELRAMAHSADGEPGFVSGRRCPIGGLRIEVGSDGRIAACPFKVPVGFFDGDLGASWLAGGRAHLDAIAACPRACAHPELAPGPR